MSPMSNTAPAVAGASSAPGPNSSRRASPTPRSGPTSRRDDDAESSPGTTWTWIPTYGALSSTPSERSANMPTRARAAASRASGTAVSHVSAVAIHGIAIFRADLRAVHLTRPGPHWNRKFEDRQVHTGVLSDSDITRVRGVAVTTVPRTLVDLARTASLITAVVAIDDALHRGLVTTDELAECAHRSRFARGHAAAVRAMRLADGRSESPGETLALIVFSPGGPSSARAPTADLRRRRSVRRAPGPGLPRGRADRSNSTVIPNTSRV